MKRRTFIGGAGGSFLSFTRSGRSCLGDVIGANERVNVALIGCGGRGLFDASHMRKVPNTRFIAVCDVYEHHARRARSRLGNQCDTYQDFRHVLDRHDVDAVVIATPDHWHAIPTVMACQAGKDAYVEKPLGHNIGEGLAMLRAAREHDRVVQTGTQQRSAAHFEQMRQLVQDGAIGNIHFVRIWNFKNTLPGGIGQKPESSIPAGLDWDMFLGPAPHAAYTENRFDNYRSFRDYSGGQITDWGTHRFDSMLHVMGPVEPLSVSAAGGRYRLDDDGDIPDLMQVTYQYPKFVLSYEATSLNGFGLGGRTPNRPYYRMMGKQDRPNGLAFYGSKGALFADRLGFEIYPELKPGKSTHRLAENEISADAFRTAATSARSDDSTYQHAVNFIDCVRSRERPVADIEHGHRATSVAHFGNIALDTGEKLHWNASLQRFDHSASANDRIHRQARAPWDMIRPGSVEFGLNPDP